MLASVFGRSLLTVAVVSCWVFASNLGVRNAYWLFETIKCIYCV